MQVVICKLLVLAIPQNVSFGIDGIPEKKLLSLINLAWTTSNYINSKNLYITLGPAFYPTDAFIFVVPSYS